MLSPGCDLTVLQAKADAVMVMAAAPPPMTLTPQATDAFTASFKETDGRSAAPDRHLRNERGSRRTLRPRSPRFERRRAKQIASFKLLQEQLSAMNVHAVQMTNAWKTFGQTATWALDDLIFSGKSFTQVLADITKQLGEMFLKWALFGFGGNGALSGGVPGIDLPGLSDLGMLSPLPAFASGGAVSAGQAIMVGENGPEIFDPSTSGTILPAGASIAPQIHITYQIDARGSSITEAQFQASLAASESRAVQRSLNMVKEVQARTA